MLEIVLKVTFWVGLVLSLMQLYQFVYAAVGFFGKKKYPEAKKEHTYGVLLACRNEEQVIGELIKSLRQTDYDQSLIKIFCVADNCTDNTAAAARDAGAIVFERSNKQEIGKGYALDFLLKEIGKAFPDYMPDGWFVFDADNLVHPDYFKEMNKAFDAGEKIVTSYRNCKNLDSNWISAVSGMALIHQCRFLQQPRAILKTSAFLSGTGWLISSELMNPETGHPYHMLTEDSQFTCELMLKGQKVAYCDDAVFYDEQPLRMRDCYKQRMRWLRGNFQMLRKYTGKFIKQTFKTGKFCFYDMFCCTFGFTGFIGTMLVAFNAIFPLVNAVIGLIGGAAAGQLLLELLVTEATVFAGTYLLMMLYASLILIMDWRRIAGRSGSKLKSILLYPVFQIATMPISVIAIFRKVKWTQIPHNDVKSIEEINSKLTETTKSEKAEKQKEE